MLPCGCPPELERHSCHPPIHILRIDRHIAHIDIDYFGNLDSETDLSAARPFSKSLPTILSMLMNRQNALLMKFFWPLMLQVTPVRFSSGLNVNSVFAVEAKGFRNSSLIRTRSVGRLSVSVIRPSPTFELPTQEQMAPVPEG